MKDIIFQELRVGGTFSELEKRVRERTDTEIKSVYHKLHSVIKELRELGYRITGRGQEKRVLTVGISARETLLNLRSRSKWKGQRSPASLPLTDKL